MPLAIYIFVGAALLVAVSILISSFLKSYLKYRRKALVICPATQKPAGVKVVAERNLFLEQCSLWPERRNCGQECLMQIELSLENRQDWESLIKKKISLKAIYLLSLNNWYKGKTCAVCGKKFAERHWHDHRPALLGPEQKLLPWEEIPVKTLPKVLSTHKPVCWNCYIDIRDRGIERRSPQVNMTGTR